MGSIKLVLNIDRVDLIIAISVVTIALLAVIGLVAWFIKTNHQHKTLEQIDNKLTPKKPDIVIREIIRNDISGDAAPPIDKETLRAAINEDDIPVSDVSEIEDDGPDVLEEIRKMMIAQEKACDDDIVKDNYNVGKSGKTYTREEIEKLIND